MSKWVVVAPLLAALASPVYAFSLSGKEPSAILRHMGFAVGAANCSGMKVNWLAHDLIFDWAEARLGGSVEAPKHKKHFVAGAEEADSALTKGKDVYCSEIARRFGRTGSAIPGLVILP